MTEKVKLGTVLEGRIDSGLIWGQCQWVSERFPFGFEYAFDALTFKKLEGEEEVVILSPHKDCQVILVRPDLATIPEWARKYVNRDDHLEIPYGEDEKMLGVSRFALMDNLLQNNTNEVLDAWSVNLAARNYTATDMFMIDGVYKEEIQRGE